MPRPLAFDRHHALETAMQLFWTQGYGATSLHDLLAAMAISRSSFYAAYGDKRGLYEEVIALFGSRTAAMLDHIRQQHDPLTAIRTFFEHTLFDVPVRRMRRGCLLVNTVLETAYVDADLSALASAQLTQIERAFQQCFEQAQASGELPAGRSPEQLARFVMILNQGLRVASRKHASRAELRDVLETSLSLLADD